MCDQMSSAHTLRIFVSTTVGWRHIPSLMTENCIFKLKKEADIQQLTLVSGCPRSMEFKIQVLYLFPPHSIISS